MEPATWHGLPPDSARCSFCNAEELVGFMKQICQMHLARLCLFERIATGAPPADGISLENAFFEASELIGGRARYYYGASQINKVLNTEAKSFVYTWLLDCILVARRKRSQFTIEQQAAGLAEKAWHGSSPEEQRS